tara:strand:+ start:221 stop:955 length:735 start_codon:yes stop_codon:yes gene_type:complete
VETINCKHVEPNGKACRRVAFRNLFYCYAHRHLYPDAETRTEYEKRRKTLSEEDPDYEPRVMKALPEDPEPRTDPAPEQEPRPLPPDWDAIQKEEGWWDDALPDATPEERKKEALANAEVAKRSLKAEEIYTVASCGGEVTDEMFGRDLSGSIIAGAMGAVSFLIAIPFFPVIVLAALGGNSLELSGPTVKPMAEALWTPPIFAFAILFGAFIGFGNHRKRAEALAKGEAEAAEAGSSAEADSE